MSVAVAILSSAMILQACGPDESGAFPAQTRLAERIRNYHQALLDGDHASRYSMQPPYLREAVSFEVWKKEFGISEDSTPTDPTRLIDTKIVETRFCDDMSSESRPDLFRCVFVIELTYEDESETKVEQLAETWDFLGDEWYFAWLLDH